MIAQSIVFTAPKTVSLQPTETSDTDLLTSRLMGISAGTERHILLGHMEGLRADPMQDCSLESFAFPLKYGYINIAQDRQGQRFFAFFPHQTHFSATEAHHMPIPEDISDEDAIFLANTETAIAIAHDLHLRLGENVLIVGAGVIGLLLAEILVRGGAGRVFVADRNPYKSQFVLPTGATFLDASQPGWERGLIQAKTPIDLGVNTSASSEPIEILMQLLPPEGTIVEASWYGNRTASLHLGQDFHRKRLRLIASQVSYLPRELDGPWTKERRFALAWDLIRKIKPCRLITHRFSLNQHQEAYQILLEEQDHIQIVLSP
jgi:threonine dehydrogenase-like Zn-dependent dehydrogenase